MSEQLKPCPFCTSDTEIRKPLGIDNQNDAIVIEEDNGLAPIESDSWGFLVRYCPMCGRPLSGTGNGAPGKGAGMSIQEAILSFYHDLRDLSELKIDDPIMYRDMGGDKEKDKMLTALAALRAQEEAEKKPPCYIAEANNPYPLCVGRGMKACAHCCLWSDYDTDEDESRVNLPLALEELRQMDGEPVWVRSKINAIDSRWGIINKRGVVFPNEAHYVIFKEYEDVWLAYRRKPKEDKAHE